MTANDSEVLNLLREFETRLNAQEHMLAELTMGLSTMWATVEQAIATVLEGKSPEEQQLFRDGINKYRTALFEAMNETSAHVGTPSGDATTPVESVAPDQ